MKSFDWTKWSAIAGVIGSIAIVITLVALLLEMRINSELARVTAYQSEIQNLNSWREELSSDQRKVTLFREYGQGAIPEVDTDEFTILSMTITNLWVNYESAYTAYRSGVIGALQWERMERNICSELRNLNRFPLSSLKEVTYFRLTADFQAYVESRC